MSVELINQCLAEALETGDAVHLRVAEDLYQDLDDEGLAEMNGWWVSHITRVFVSVVEGQAEGCLQLVENELYYFSPCDWERVFPLVTLLLHWAELRGEESIEEIRSQRWRLYYRQSGLEWFFRQYHWTDWDCNIGFRLYDTDDIPF